MSKFCCGIAYGENETHCMKCGKVLENIKDSAFVPEEDIDNMPTVIIDVESVNRIAGNDSVFDTVTGGAGYEQAQYSGRDSAFVDVSTQAGGGSAFSDASLQAAADSDSVFEQVPVQAVAVQQGRPGMNQTGALRQTGTLSQGRPAPMAVQQAEYVERPAGAVVSAESEKPEKSGRHVGLLVTSIIILSIAVLGFISMVFLNFKYTIKNNYDKYEGTADKGFHDELVDTSFGGQTDIGGDD